MKAVRRNFSENTSCHGIPQMYTGKSKWQKGFWCFLVLAVLGFLVSQVSQQARFGIIPYGTTLFFGRLLGREKQAVAQLLTFSYKAYISWTLRKMTELVRILVGAVNCAPLRSHSHSASLKCGVIRRAAAGLASSVYQDPSMILAIKNNFL